MRPSWWTWYVLYCVSLAVAYAGGALLGVALASGDLGGGDEGGRLFGVVCIALCLPLLAASIGGCFVPPTRLGWIVGLVLLALGMTSACWLPFSVLLLLKWIAPETKNAFGMKA